MKKFILISLLLVLSSISYITNAQTTKTVGGTVANYSTIKDAFDAINDGSLHGAVTLQITGSTTETASAVLNASGSGNANYTSVIIYPTFPNLSIAGDFSASTIDLRGADNITIDGRVNQSGSSPDLTISNISTGTFASAIRFIGSAESNTVRFCILKSSCYSTGVGMINFTSSTTGNGNDNNIIEYCNITNAGNRPVNAIFSSGSAGRENSGNIIRNNNIFDFFSANTSSYGINISNSSTDWTITDNSFYETTTFAPIGTYKYYPLFINTGTNNIVSNNYIGGSEPLCAGSAFSVNANSAHYFCGIFINGGTAATMQNNIIQNMNYTSVEDNPWDGIWINSGTVDVTGNTIGATSGTGSVVVTTPVASATSTISGGVVTAINLNGGGSGYTTPPAISFSSNSGGTGAAATAVITGGSVTGFELTNGGTGYTSAPSVYFDGQSTTYSVSHGMIKQSAGTVTISENNIGSITTIGSADRYSHGFEPIYVRGVAGTLTISNNLIGSLTTENSIHASSTAAFSLQKQDIYGIYCAGTGTTTISGNTVANLHNAYSGINSGARTRGILTTAGSNTVQNNTVRNISTASGQSSFGSSASVIGISQISATAGTTQKVTGNTIYGISNTNTNYVRVDIYGMYFAGPNTGTHEVSGNFVHSLSVSSANLGSDIDGIVINSGSVVTCANNIVNLGKDNTLGYKINGIWDGTLAGNTVNFYFNTVYIGGTVTSGVTSITSALNNANNTSTRNYRNNILYNARSGGTTGKHYAIVIAGVAGLTIDYNNYFFAGPMLGKIGTLEKADLIAWKAGTGQDANSLSINPDFTLAGGTNALDYNTSASLPGVSGTGITTDYNENARAATPKMGALEANNYTWQGGTSDVFGLAANWVGNAVPPDGADISFAANPDRNCVLDQNRTLGDITNAQAIDILVVNGNQLSITGDLIFSGGAQIDATDASSVVVFAGTAAQSIPSGAFVSNTIDFLTINNVNELILNGDLTINTGIALISGNFTIGANTLTFNGIVTAMTGTVTGGSSTNMIIGGTGSIINMPAFVLNNLTINRTSGVSLYGDLSIVGTLALTNGTLTVGRNTLTISGSSPLRTSGTIDAGNVSATLAFTNSSAITLPASVFSAAVNNLTINSTGGITAGSDFTVNGILNLQGANPSATKSSLDMGANTLTMSANATTIGVGDVTGIVKRTSLVANTVYSFGNPFTTVTFPNTGILPSDWSFKIIIGIAPTWKVGAIQRTYDIIRTGGSGSLPTIKLHYKYSELNGNDEEDLVFWGNYPSATGYGRINSNITDNWVSLSGSIEFAPTSFGQREWSLSKSELSGFTWLGAVPGQETDWNANMNWAGGSVPTSTSDVIIPAGCTHYPTLPSNTTINSISIENGATVNGGTSTSLIINGGNAAWYNRGTFNPQTSTIAFANAAATMSGITDFYNLTVNSGAGVTLTTDNILRIAGSLGNSGSLNATEFPNTVEYNGDNQTIINPNGATPGYYDLILSGTGTKTLPATVLSVAGDFTISGTATATAASAITIAGNVTIGTGSTFATGAFNHSVAGNIENNATITAATGYGITMNGSSAQWIGGTSTTNFYNLTINNNNGVTLYTNENINNVLSLTSGNLIVDATTLGINGTISKTSGFIEVDPTSSLSFGGTDGITITSDLFTTPPSLNNLTINRSGGVTLGNQDITVNGLLHLPSGTFTLAANTLTIAGSSPTRTSGTIDASNAAASLAFTNPVAITLPASIFTGNVNNLTINGTGGVTATSDFTINGILHLQSDNPLATKGSLDMWDGSAMKTLTMGASATTVGAGDVTGIVTRAPIIAGVTYTFGNEFTTAYFPNNGTMPDQMSVKIRIGTVPSWQTGAIAREIAIIQTSGTNTKAVFSLHYLDTELNGNIEENVVLWVGPTPNLEYGRSVYNSTDNWIALSNIDVGNYFSSSWDANKNITIDEAGTASTLTWNGSLSTSWTSIENWTPNVGPSSDKNIIIPDASTTSNSPTLPSATDIKTLTIQGAGILNSVPDAQLTINGGSSAWNNTGGTFNPNTSKVIFTGTDATIAGITNFYDVATTIGKVLWLSTGSTMRIAGTMTNAGTWRTVIGGPTTVEYNGGNQTVVVPNPATNRYSTLILSGSGTKTMPSSALSIEGDFSMTGTTSATALAAITFANGFTLGSGTTFNAGSFTHSLFGNLENNGATFNTSGSTFEFNGTTTQTIGGTTSSNFNNLTINNLSGVSLSAVDATVNNTLTLTSGRLDITNKILTFSDGATAVAGTLNSTNMIIAEGGGEVRKNGTTSAEATFTFPVGDNTGTAEYSPIGLTFSGGTYAGYSGVNVTNSKHPQNASSTDYLNRYWTVTSSGITSFSCDITATYLPVDIAGAESSIKAGEYSGSLPWVKYPALNGNTLTANGVTGFGDFTGITSAAPSVSIAADPALTVCKDVSLTLNANPVGDPTFTYSWLPNGETSQSVTPSTSSPGSTLYTVTVTDGNGFTATDGVTVVVTETPVAPALDTASPSDGSTICAGFNTGTVTGAAGSGGSTGAADEY